MPLDLGSLADVSSDCFEGFSCTSLVYWELGGRVSNVHLAEQCGILNKLRHGDLIWAVWGLTTGDATDVYWTEVSSENFIFNQGRTSSEQMGSRCPGIMTTAWHLTFSGHFSKMSVILTGHFLITCDYTQWVEKYRAEWKMSSQCQFLIINTGVTHVITRVQIHVERVISL